MCVCGGGGGGGLEFQPLCQSPCNSNCNTIIVESDIPRAPRVPSHFWGEEQGRENKRFFLVFFFSSF